MLENQQIVSDRDQYRTRLEGYLETVLQRSVSLQDWSGHQRLPAFLSRLYRFFETRLGQTPLLFMCARRSEELTPTEIASTLIWRGWSLRELYCIPLTALRRVSAHGSFRVASLSQFPATNFLFPNSQRTCENTLGHPNRNAPTSYRHRLKSFCSSIC